MWEEKELGLLVENERQCTGRWEVLKKESHRIIIQKGGGKREPDLLYCYAKLIMACKFETPT